MEAESALIIQDSHTSIAQQQTDKFVICALTFYT